MVGLEIEFRGAGAGLRPAHNDGTVSLRPPAPATTPKQPQTVALRL